MRSPVAHQHHAEVRAHLAGVGEKLHDAVGRRVGRDIEIFGCAAQKQVAHASAHQVRLVAGFAQRPDCGRAPALPLPSGLSTLC